MLKHQLLLSNTARSSTGLIAAIVEPKCRNPKFGCVRVAQQISHAFDVGIDKDVVRRVLAKQCQE